MATRPLKFVPKINQVAKRKEISRGEYTYNNSAYYGVVTMVQDQPFGFVNGNQVPLNIIVEQSIARDTMYESLTKFNPTKWKAPIQEYRRITDEERGAGVIIRYIFRKKTTGEFTETAKRRSSTAIDSNAINGSLYDSFELPWKISGEAFEVAAANETTLKKFDQYYPGIKKYLSDYLEFYRK